MPEKLGKNESDPCYTIPCNDIVHAVAFSPFKWSNEFIAIATSTRITIGTFQHQNESSNAENYEFNTLREIHHSCRTSSIAWSPETSLSTITKVIKFCTAGSDKNVRIFSSDIQDKVSVQIATGHTDYINDVVFNPESGEHIASVSDDHTCRLWDLKGSLIATLPLESPGMTVKWHPEDCLKIMVAQKCGSIVLFYSSSQQPIMSLNCNSFPLLSADWSTSNLVSVCAVAGPDIFFFDISKSSLPTEIQPCHKQSCQKVAISHSNDNLIASIGSPGAQIRIFNTQLKKVIISKNLRIANDVSWHCTSPFVAFGGDRKVIIWHCQ